MREPIVRLAPQRGRAQHPGLLLNRYLVEHDKEGKDKRALMEAACAAGNDPVVRALYGNAFARWQQGFPEPNATATVATPAHTRLIVGLGNKGVVDAGLRLHHTYGLPVIPGSALKGLTAHYCATVWGAEDPRYGQPDEKCDPEKVNFYNLLFGTTEEAGLLRFEDAWMVPGSESLGILMDVMTPHHQKWQTDENVAPTDFDSPIPVPFLSVAGQFHLVVCWQGPEHDHGERWTRRGLQILRLALRDWGVGGKTSSGYGRLVDPSEATSAGGPTAATGARQPAGPTANRSFGTPTKVKIVGPRAGGKGFDVQEVGKLPGTLTLGTPPAGVNTEKDSIVDVLVHNDDPKKPQYRWPDPPKPGKR